MATVNGKIKKTNIRICKHLEKLNIISFPQHVVYIYIATYFILNEIEIKYIHFTASHCCFIAIRKLHATVSYCCRIYRHCSIVCQHLVF